MSNITKSDIASNVESITIKSIDTDDKSIIKNEILKASEAGLINSLIDSNLALTPKLIVNDYSKGSKVLTEIISELTKCKEFFISVAFITSSGITPLLETFKYLDKKGIKGIKWIAHNSSRPITLSNSSKTLSNSFTMSYPAS